MPYRHIYFDADACTGCNTCVEVCMCDALEANPVAGEPPTERYPDECWFCGCCVSHCPRAAEGAIELVTPLPMRGAFLKKKGGGNR